jgi:hypothetical protein
MDYSLCADPEVYLSQGIDSFQDDDNQNPARENPSQSSIESLSFLTEENFSLSSSALPPDIFDGMENMTLGPLSLDESRQSTIISSNPSGSSIFHPPEANRDVSILSPHPQLTTTGTRSVSTTNTELYSTARVLEERSFLDRSFNDEGSRSVASSPSTSVGILPITDRSSSASFENGAFERVASQLISDSSNDGRPNCWHDRFLTDSDWDRFRAISKNLLPFISEDSESVSQCLLPLPPTPEARASTASSRDLPEVTYHAEDLVPSDFVCSICKDVLVGACILDCNCRSSTVCMGCWENIDCDRQDLAARMDYVWVESKKCPSCHSNADVKVSCHALDVAILRIIQDLPDSDASVACLKQKYFSRLSKWRKTVSDRNERYIREKAIRDDELLARLIQEEERVFWDQTRTRSLQKRNPFGTKLMIFGKALLALIAAVGLKQMSKR